MAFRFGLMPIGHGAAARGKLVSNWLLFPELHLKTGTRSINFFCSVTRFFFVFTKNQIVFSVAVDEFCFGR